MPGVSIVIPTFNEANYLGRTLKQLHLLAPAAGEIIVVDGGSQDKTVEIANAAGIKSIVSPNRGRAAQMNWGAEVATGEMLCFVHADTLVPEDLVAIIQTVLGDRQVACGGFISVMEGGQTTRWGVVLNNFLKTYYAPLLFRPHLFFGKGLRVLFGDQVIFCRRDDFWSCGGFDTSLSICEDANLCLRLLDYGRIRLVNRIVRTSDRRVEKLGALRANAIYFYVGILWGLGISADYLKRFYQDIR
ncbi:MAG: glycosyltransferase [Chloroflexaceae bacterium]|nr:glycosyltransferase [Chloroflexaceae bacterium]